MFNYTESLHWGPHPIITKAFFYHLLKMIARKKYFKLKEQVKVEKFNIQRIDLITNLF